MLKKLLLTLFVLSACVAPIASITANAQDGRYYDEDYRDRRYAPPRGYRYDPPPPPIYREYDRAPRYSSGGFGATCRAVKNTVCQLRRPQPIGVECNCVTGSGANREGYVTRY